MPNDDLEPPQASHAWEHKGTLKISDTRAENERWLDSLCSASRFPPSASRWGRLCPGGPSATWRSPGALWPAPEKHTIQHDDYTNDKYFHQLKTVRHIWFKLIATGPQTAL